MKIGSDGINEVAPGRGGPERVFGTASVLFTSDITTLFVALAYAQLGDKHAAEGCGSRGLRGRLSRPRCVCRTRPSSEPGWVGICRNVTRQMIRTRNRPIPAPISR